MKILVGIPCLYGGSHCIEAFRSVVNEADLLIIDNGGDESVKWAIREINKTHDTFVIENKKNIYVNPAWNQIMNFFIHNDYDQLVIMNSDLILRKGWSNYLYDEISCVPSDGGLMDDVVVTEGTPGVFIHMNKQMVKMVYPIPEQLKVWFGDNWIYEILRSEGIKTIVKCDLVARHWCGGSQTVQRVPGISEIIEQDKIEWDFIQRLRNEKTA